MKRFDINSGFKKVIQFNLAKRWYVLFFFLIITALAIPQVLKLRFDFNPEAMLEFSEEEIAYQQAFDEKFQSNSNVFLLVFSYAGSQDISLYNSEALKDLRDLTDIVGKIEGIEGSYSLARVPDNKADNKLAMMAGHLEPMIPDGEVSEDVAEKVQARVRESELLNGNLISKDGKYAMIMATLAPESLDPNKFYEVYEATAAAVEKWQENDNNSEYKIAYGGLPYIRAEIVDRMKTEQFILWPVVGVLYILALCVVFRSFWQAILPLICIGCVIIWAIAIMVLCDMPVTMINNTLPLLILVIGVTNGIYVLMRILDERRKGKDKTKAITDGVFRVALATLLTTSTTSIGFGSLLIAKTKILNGFGGITALAVMLIYVAIIFLMPQVASLFPLEVNPDENKNKDDDARLLDRFLSALTKLTIHSRALIVPLSIVVLAASLAFAVTNIRFDSRVNDVFMDEHSIAVTNHIIEENLGGMLPVEVDVWGPEEGYFLRAENLAVFCKLQKEIQKVNGILSAISVCNLLEEGEVRFDGDELPTQLHLGMVVMAAKKLQSEQFNRFMTSDGSNVHISLRIPDDGFENSKKTIAAIRALAGPAFENTPIQYRLTGIGYNSTLGLDNFMNDLFSSLIAAFVIIFALLFVAFRSFWAGVTAILPNLIPICLTLAALPLFDFNLNTTSVLVFTISIGLAVDNSIHIISRFRQEYRGERTVNEALIIAMKSSGRAILQSNILLCSGLAILLVSDFDPIRRVGILTITTIGAALVVSLILIPAEISFIGHKMRLSRFKESSNPELPVKESSNPELSAQNGSDTVVNS